MRRRNDGKGEVNALQNRFTAYLLVAVRRQKCAYINKQNKLNGHEISVDYQLIQFANESDAGRQWEDSLLWQMEDTPLMQALDRLTPRERCILFEHVLEGRSYAALSELLDLQYNGAAAVCRKVLRKLRKDLEGGKY